MECIRKTISGLAIFETPKILRFKSKRIGITNISLQILILTYIVGYGIVWEKRYQTTCPVTSAVITKVKGVVYTNLTGHQQEVGNSSLYERIWDPTDYTFPTPGHENGGFFITTNVIITPNQTRGKCPESLNVEGAVCNADSDCPIGHSLPVGNGVFTGKCVTGQNEINKTCEIYAWCPVELDDPHIHDQRALLEGSENFTVFIKNWIEFVKFGEEYKRKNVLENANVTYIHKCIYNATTDPYCPIFRIGDIVKAARENFSEVAVRGAVFEIEIYWDCNLDRDFLEHCRPQYYFRRMDSPDSLISWNFRTAEYHEENRRTLFKTYGIKFIVKVTGQAGKFNFVPLLINLGSLLGLLGLAAMFCNFLLSSCGKNRHYYNEQKYLAVPPPDERPNDDDDSSEDKSPILADQD
ncbi:unnamed protein product [Orchesella dallaii]|uniref:ATP receptor n=1 Tax=Orchesella dallaii TaxID=48710 RepID=A0ABP1S4T2_9HEXA